MKSEILKPFLSIIVPIYNIEQEYLIRCLDSIVNQDSGNYIVYLVDDGSTNDAGLICDEYVKKYECLNVIHQPNGGVSVARNKGLNMAETEWIAFVDPDDWIEKNYVSVLYDAVNGNNADVFLFDYYQEFAERQIEKKLMRNSSALSHEWAEALSIAPFNSFRIDGKVIEYETNVLWNKVYRSKLIRESGILFDPEARKGQDVIFNAEIFQIASKYHYIRNALYHYRYLNDSITNRFNPKAMFYNELAFGHYLRIIEKYNLPEKYLEAFWARVVTRLYSGMRLYYFHNENKESPQKMNQAIKELIEKEPYASALKNVDYRLLSKEQIPFVYFLKRKNIAVLRMLVKARKIVKDLKGLKLN